MQRTCGSFLIAFSGSLLGLLLPFREASFQSLWISLSFSCPYIIYPLRRLQEHRWKSMVDVCVGEDQTGSKRRQDYSYICVYIVKILTSYHLTPIQCFRQVRLITWSTVIIPYHKCNHRPERLSSLGEKRHKTPKSWRLSHPARPCSKPFANAHQVLPGFGNANCGNT